MKRRTRTVSEDRCPDAWDGGGHHFRYRFLTGRVLPDTARVCLYCGQPEPSRHDRSKAGSDKGRSVPLSR